TTPTPPAEGATAGSVGRPRVGGTLSLSFFPPGIAPNFASASLSIPLSRRVAIVPHVGAGYIPPPADDSAGSVGRGGRRRPRSLDDRAVGVRCTISQIRDLVSRRARRRRSVRRSRRAAYPATRAQRVGHALAVAS